MPRYNTPRPYRKKDIERQVRYSCNYGCIFCGLPIYNYHHIDGNRENNDNANIVLLCPSHHGQVTSGQIGTSEVKSTASNLRKKLFSTPHKIYFNDKLNVLLGNNIIQQLDGYVFNFLDQNYLKIIQDKHQLKINAQFIDDEGNKSFIINDNEYSYSTQYWDIECISRRIIIRKKSRDILLEIEFDGEHKMIIIHNAKIFILPEMPLEINSRGIFAGKSYMSKCVCIEAKYGLAVFKNGDPRLKISGCSGIIQITNGVNIGGDIAFGWSDEDYKANFPQK